MIIGIDLGTTNSVAAYMGLDGPKLIPNALGEYLTPSVVGIDRDGKILVGKAAKEYQVVQPQRCASLFKRYMGSDRKLDLAGKSLSPEQLSSLVLKSLKQDAEAFFGAPVHEAVITVPAYFNDNQRKATIAAGQMAGFEVKRILNEPTAASLAYGMYSGGEDRTLMILDLGGGTFDVSIIEVCLRENIALQQVIRYIRESNTSIATFFRIEIADKLASDRSLHTLLDLLQKMEMVGCVD